MLLTICLRVRQILSAYALALSFDKDFLHVWLVGCVVTLISANSAISAGNQPVATGVYSGTLSQTMRAMTD